MERSTQSSGMTRFFKTNALLPP